MANAKNSHLHLARFPLRSAFTMLVSCRWHFSWKGKGEIVTGRWYSTSGTNDITVRRKEGRKVFTLRCHTLATLHTISIILSKTCMYPSIVHSNTAILRLCMWKRCPFMVSNAPRESENHYRAYCQVVVFSGAILESSGLQMRFQSFWRTFGKFSSVKSSVL